MMFYVETVFGFVQETESRHKYTSQQPTQSKFFMIFEVVEYESRKLALFVTLYNTDSPDDDLMLTNDI